MIEYLACHRDGRDGRVVMGVAPKAGYSIKGSLVRGYLEQVRRLAILPEVIERVSASSRQLIADPPMPSTWLDASVIEEMVNAVEELRGLEGVRALTAEGLKTGLLALMQPVIAGMLRLFGATPETLLSRFGEFAAGNVKGLSFRWERESDRAGKLHIQFPRQVPRNAFIGFESGCRIILDLCSKQGRVEDAVLAATGGSGFVRVSW
jgi:hypothetical protein